MKKIALLLMVVCLMVSTASFALAADMLEISEVTVYVDGDKDTVSDGGNVDNAKPGSDIKIKVEVRNLYTDRDDEIKDIEIELVGDELDDDEDDWEDDDEIDELKGDRKDDVTFNHKLPLDVADEEHTITITATSKRDCPNSSDTCSDELEFTLEVEKEKHELLISSATLEPQVLACDGSSILTIKIYNIGREDEDETVLGVKNTNLDINFEEEFDIETCPGDDCSITKTFDIEYDEGYGAGTYPLSIKLTYDEGDETLTKTVNLDVEECAVEEVMEEEEEVEVIIEEEEEEMEEEITEVPEAVPVTGAATAAPFSVEEIAIISLIVLGVVLVVILVIFLVVRAAKKQ